MVGVSTVALIERKPTISRSLFSRYWRDVHGVMAARIPGFDSYTQYHVTPAGGSAPEPFDGIAIVTYVDEAHRQGLLTSEITRHIHRDEANVFRRALLYNLGAGDRRALIAGAGPVCRELFLVVPAGIDVASTVDALPRSGLLALWSYDLVAGDPGAWNETDVDDDGSGRRFIAVLHLHLADEAGTQAVVSTLDERIAAYAIDAVHAMVENGRPTAVGLRGLDAVKTIEEAGAVNQLEDAVVDAVYGRLGRARAGA